MMMNILVVCECLKCMSQLSLVIRVVVRTVQTVADCSNIFQHSHLLMQSGSSPPDLWQVAVHSSFLHFQCLLDLGRTSIA